MPTPARRSPIRRRLLSLTGFALILLGIGVANAGGATGGSSDPTPAVSGFLVPPVSTTPANQPALDSAADDAQRVAGDAYYTDSVVNDAANTVDVYLAGAPQSIIDQLQALHPGIYIIHNDAAHPLTELLNDERSLPLASLRAQGVDVRKVYPTPDGHLEVGVTESAAAAQPLLDSLHGSGFMRAYSTNEAPVPNDYRYSDSVNWKGGDFIRHYGTDIYSGLPAASDCSSGIPVHDTANGATYMLTAAHCFWPFGVANGSTPVVENGYDEDNRTVYGSNTVIGYQMRSDTDALVSTTQDTALIDASTGTRDFVEPWNSPTLEYQVGEAGNHSGDYVCDSGAFDGEICGIEIHNVNVEITYSEEWGYMTVKDLAQAWDPTSSSAIATGDGDSGGPVYSYNSTLNQLLARGMIQGGSGGLTCPGPSAGGPTGVYSRGCYHTLYFEEQGYINSDWGVAPNT